jgi:1-acyl-sn-glycerol-3-phosphate acyltransferase
MPDVPKLVLIGAPHTSNWDAIAATFSMLSVGLHYTILVKKEWFFWPMGPIFRAVGGYPVDRGKNAAGMVEQLADMVKEADKIVLGFPPEGTRSKVAQYKTGYLRVAYATGVPVFLAAFDGANKRVYLDRLFELSGDLEADNKMIKAYVDDTWTGINPDRQ